MPFFRSPHLDGFLRFAAKCSLRFAEQFRKKTSHDRSFNDSQYCALFVAVRNGSCKSEIRPPDDLLLVAFPPNSGPANTPWLLADAGSIIGHRVVATRIKIVVMKFHLILGRKRQHRTTESCRPDSYVKFVPCGTDDS